MATREPGAACGGAIRQILLEGEAIDARTELFLFLADRAQHVASLIRPALAEGKIVLCDRHADSTVVYQGYGRGLDLEMLREWNAYATAGLKPSLTLLLDLDPNVGLLRLTRKDRLDGEPLSFHEKVRAGFLAEAKREPERWHVVHADKPVPEVVAACLAAIRARLTA